MPSPSPLKFYLLFPIFLGCIIQASIANSHEQDPNSGSVNSCPRKIKALDTIPGRGWCNLRNREMGQITRLTYFQCKTTPDGLYYIPDNTFAIPSKESSLKLYSDFIDNWSNYTSITASSFSATAENSVFGGNIGGSFSTEYQETKERQVDQNSVTSRTYVRNIKYTVQTEPTIGLDPGFKSQVMEVVKQIKVKDTRKMIGLLQLIVRDYGTHFLRRLDAGGILLQEDFLSRSFAETNKDKMDDIKAAASATFFSALAGPLGISHNVESSVTSGYLRNLKSSNVRTYGGTPIKSTAANQTSLWIDSLPANLVAVDRFGDPLHFIISSYNFPKLDPAILETLQTQLKSAIVQYYTYNTHVGCTDVGSPNFEYTANVDDKSCKSRYNNYTFGGNFMKCESHSGGNGNLCDEHPSQKNLLTGDYSCPPGFEEMLLRTRKYRSFSSGGSLFWAWQEESRAETKSYWCYRHGDVDTNSGALFGGTFTNKMVNPLTQARSCPPTFEDRMLGDNFHICLGLDYELGYKFSVPFGGFFSCQYGNPLFDIPVRASFKKHFSSARNYGEYPFSCPPGCSQHTAIVDDDCAIMYCVKANSMSTHGALKIKLPPFVDGFLDGESDGAKSGMGGADSGQMGWNFAGIILAGNILLVIVFCVFGIIYRRRESQTQTAILLRRISDHGGEIGTKG